MSNVNNRFPYGMSYTEILFFNSIPKEFTSYDLQEVCSFFHVRINTVNTWKAKWLHKNIITQHKDANMPKHRRVICRKLIPNIELDDAQIVYGAITQGEFGGSKE